VVHRRHLKLGLVDILKAGILSGDELDTGKLGDGDARLMAERDRGSTRTL